MAGIEEAGCRLVNAGEVGWVIELLGQRVGDDVLRRQHVRGVGFDEQPIGRDCFEGIAHVLFAFVEEIP